MAKARLPALAKPRPAYASVILLLALVLGVVIFTKWVLKTNAAIDGQPVV